MEKRVERTLSPAVRVAYVMVGRPSRGFSELKVMYAIEEDNFSVGNP